MRTADADSAAHAHMLWLEGLGLDVAGAGVTESAFMDAAAEDDATLDVSLLEGLVDLDLGEISLPLIKPAAGGAGLLHLGSLGAAGSHSESTSETTSMAATGLLTEDGALDVDAYAGDVADPAHVDLTALIEQILGAGALDELLSEATIQVGAVGSQIAKNGPDVTSSYRIADLEANFTSPLLADVTGLTNDLVDGVLEPVTGLVGEEGAITGAVGDLVTALDAIYIDLVQTGVNANLDALGINTDPLTNALQSALLASPLDNSTAEEPATVSIDLSTGTIAADLGGLLLASNSDYTDLNDLPANTDVLSDAVVNALTEGVASALTGTGPNSLTSKVVDIVSDGIYDVELNVDLTLGVEVLGGDATNTTASLQDVDGEAATLGGILGIPGYPAVELNVADEGVLEPVIELVSPLLNGLVGTLSGLIGDVLDGAAGEGGLLDTLQPTVNGILNPIISGLIADDGALKTLLNEVAELTINAQPAVGDLGEGSSTVRALNLTVLPLLGDAAVTAELASSTVKAADIAYDTAITVTPGTIQQGESTTIDGTGFAPEESVSVTIDGVEVGPVTTDADGSFSLPYTAADDAPTGTFDVVATGEVSNTPATGELTIEAADTGADPDADADTAADPDADADTAADPDADADTAADPDADADTAADPDADADTAADPDADADTAADPDADADTAADPDSSTNADADADPEADSTSAADPDSSADADTGADPDSTSNADADADPDSSADADAGADPDSAADADAGVNADADADGSDADQNTNASASASASANADDDSNASAQAAAQAAAQADASTSASASADADATAAAQVAANADASSDASADVSSEANASSQAAAQAAAQADASSASNADATSAAEGNASAAAAAASNADSSSDASAAAAANADAASDGDGAQISMELDHERLQVGEEQVAHGHGFEPGETVTATQYSTPYAIGEQVADGNGDVTFTWDVPEGSELGNHVVELTGETSGTVDASFEVYSASDLSPTGGDMAWTFGGIAAAMLLAGAGVWLTVRRRTHA